MSDFNWNDLRYFLDVARSGRLTTSARRLGVDHTTVSRRIAALEEALHVTLFERRPTGYSLTVHGKQLLETAESMESTAFSAQNTIGNADLSVAGTVRIGAPDGFGSIFLAPRIGTLTHRYPDLEVQLVAMPRIFNLSKREADIAIGLSCPNKGRLFVRKLTDYQLRLYAAKSYLDQYPPIRSRQDLAGHVFIGYIDDLVFAPELDYIAAVSEATPRLTSSNLLAQVRATVAGAGLCIIPRFMADDEPGLIPVLPDEVSLTRTFWLMVHEDLRPLARIAVAAQFIAEAVRQSADLFDPPG